MSIAVLSRAPRRASRRRAPQARPVAAIRPGEVEETVSVLSAAFAMTAIVGLWFLLQVLLLSGISQARSQDLLYQDFRRDLAEATVPTGGLIEPGTPVALLTIPKLGMQQVVIEGTASGDLQAGPGHRRDTPLPGQAGAASIYARAATYGAPFGKIATLERGDQIIAQIGQGRTVFKVAGVRRAGDTLPAPVAEGGSRLTLVSAEGRGRLASLRPQNAVYVDAVATTALPAPAGRPAAIPASEKALAGDPSALPMLALALALLVGLALATAAARMRWPTALVWVIATPVAITLSWFTTDVVVRLLPNLM